MKIKNKKILTIGTLLLTASPVAAIISCSKFDFDNLDYDFGIAIKPISSLNYVKYNDTKRILPTLVQGLIQSGPNTDLKNQLQLPKFTFGRSLNPVLPSAKGGALKFKNRSGFEIYTVSNSGYYAGNLKTGDLGASYTFKKDSSGKQDSSKGLDLFTFSLNGLQKFKGTQKKFSRVIEAKDYIDYVKYVLDLNVGSPHIINFEELKIKGIEDIIVAQKNYARKFGKSYKAPFGQETYKIIKGIRTAVPKVKITKDTSYSNFNLTKIGNEGWTSQTNGDQNYVLDIKKAALKFMLEGMRVSYNSVNGEEILDDAKDEVKKNGFTKTDFFIAFENQNQSPANFLINNVGNYLKPINKEFVDNIGGIEKFGTSFENWQYSSPFNINNIRLGQGGYIDLEKDKFWPTKEYTISNKVKIYFNSQPNILSTMFEDKYISDTTIPAIFQSKFWADPNLRQFMKKAQGFGTQALQFNLDKSTNGNSPLQNENFRNAIAHSIDRARLLKLLNWDSSFPVTTWTPLGGVIKTFDGRIIDDFLSSTSITGPHRKEPYSLSTIPWAVHTATKYKFEQAERTDNRFNLEEAQAYYKDYVKETGNTSNINLTFLSADPTNTNAAIGISSMLNKALKGKVKLKVKIVPENSYEILRTTGQFDMTTFNFDQYGSSPDSYIKRLITKVDEIDLSKNKGDGFIDNPTGSWTLHQWYLEHKNELAKYEKYFNIPPSGKGDIIRKTWDKLIDIVKLDPRDDTQSKTLRTKFQTIINRQDDYINTYNKLFFFITQIEKIIALSSPIVSLLDVDNKWTISRLGGVTNTYTYSLQYAYDVLNKPYPTLPGKESLKNG